MPQKLRANRLSHLAHGETFPTDAQRHAREGLELEQIPKYGWDDPRGWSDEKLRRKINQAKSMEGLALHDNDAADAKRHRANAETYNNELKGRSQ